MTLLEFDPLHRMAELILEDPVITVAELARRLGYAEEKTCYYWMAKAHYHGLRSFKRAVLGGHYRVHSASRAHEARTPYGRVSIAASIHWDGQATLSGESIFLPMAGVATLAWRYPGPQVGGIFAGDLLVLGPKRLDQDMNYPLRLVRTQGPSLSIRRALPGPSDTPRLVDYTSLRPDPFAETLYVVLQLLRPYGPPASSQSLA